MENWFLDNLEKLVPIIIAILYFLGANKAKKMEEQQEEDPEAEARARRIQEEIRRKILERQQGSQPTPPPPRHTPPPIPSPAQLNREIEMPLYPREPKTVREVAEVELASPRYMAPEPVIFEAEDPFEAQRAEIEEQLRKARELRKKAPKATRHSAAYRISEGSVPSMAALRAGVKSDLQSAESIRRAIVLKEILDRPLALR